MAKTRRQSRLEKLNRIESLHINLLHQILSFLPTLQVVQTSVLSKTWRNIWRSIPSLYFHENPYQSSTKFVSMVDTVLAQRDDESNVEKFHLNLFSYDNNQKINSWLEYAVQHKIQILNLDSTGWMTDFTCQVSCFKSLVHLTLCRCYISLRTPTLLPNLKIMELDYVDFVDDEQNQIPLVSLYPSLESLVMDIVRFPSSLIRDNKLIISAPKLKKLDVDCYLPSLVEISAPNLVSLKLLNSEYTEKGVVIGFDNGTGFSMVEHAHIRVKLGNSESVVQLFRALENVGSLELYSNVLKSVSMEMQKDLRVQECIQTPLLKLKQLKLQTSFNVDDIFVINTLLKHSSTVESLILNNISYCYLSSEEDYNAKVEDSNAKVWSDEYEMFHLKQVVIHKFRGSEREIRFVEFLLRNAPTLKKLIINIFIPYVNRERNEIFRKKKKQLYMCVRASSSVKIMITQEP